MPPLAKSFYVYLHFTPNGDPFYVGKGSGLRSHDLNGRNKYHKRIVKKYGIEILVFQRDSEQDAFNTEITWIKVLRDAGYKLCNCTDGGEGVSGYEHSIETKKLLSDIGMGKQNHLGFKNSEESKAKMSRDRKGRKSSPEACIKNSCAAKRSWADPVFREKMMASRKEGSKNRQKEISKLIGIKRSEETKKKMSIARNATLAMKRFNELVFNTVFHGSP